MNTVVLHTNIIVGDKVKYKPFVWGTHKQQLTGSSKYFWPHTTPSMQQQSRKAILSCCSYVAINHNVILSSIIDMNNSTEQLHVGVAM